MPPSEVTTPRFPIYIPSKSRSDSAYTMKAFDWMGVPYRVIVEAEQHDVYAERLGAERLLVLPRSYQDEYEMCGEFDPEESRGSGPARNFAWEHSMAEGHDWHWVVDDNIEVFERFHENARIPVADGMIFHAMETFCLRYRNVAMAGPNYHTFVHSRQSRPAFQTGTRIYSCILIRNSIPFRWRGRYNEDTILSLSVLKADWNTVLFNAFLQYKLPTQILKGGNTEAFYAAEGTLPKSQMLVRLHSDVARLAWRWGRWHHFVDYSEFRDRPLIPDPAWDRDAEPTYRFGALRPRTRAVKTAADG